MTQYSTNSNFSTDAGSTQATGNATTNITGWTVVNPTGGSAGANSTYTITAEAGAEGGKYCAAQETGWDTAAHFLSFDDAGTIATSTACEWLFRFRFPALSSNETLVGKFLYSGGNYYSLRCFTSGAAQLYYYQGTSAWSSVGAADSTPDRSGTASAFTTATWYWGKVVKTAAGLWSWKAWDGVIADEPAGWSLGDGGSGGTSETTVTTGATGIGMRDVNQDIDYDWFSVGTGGDTAPVPGGGGGGAGLIVPLSAVRQNTLLRM